MSTAPLLRQSAAALLVALPWLHPFTFGPSAAIGPWLVGAACGIALWALCGRASHLPRGLAWACAALVAWAALSQLALQPDTAMLAAGLLLFLLAASAAHVLALARALQAGLLVAATASAVFGLLQYFGWSAAFSPWINAAEAGEAFANVRQPNQFASLCWLGAAVVLFGTLPLRRPAAALVVLFAVASAASGSRTGALELVALLVLAAWWRGPQRRERWLLAAIAAAAYVAAVPLLPLALEAWTGEEAGRALWSRVAAGDGCFSRLVLWSNVLRLVALQPLAGWGWGGLDLAHYLTLYSGPRFCEILDNAHNLPLHLAVELGVPVALLACGGVLAWILRARPWGEQDPLRQLAWALFAIIMLHSLLEYPLWYGPFQIALGIAVGWLFATDAGAQPEVPAGARPRLLAAAVMAAALAYAAWDYLRVSQIYLPPEDRRAGWAEDTLAHVRRSWLFSGHAGFAEFTLTAPTRANAQWMYAMSTRALRHSPEPRVIERAIESATATGHVDEAAIHLARFRAAFPQDYAAWQRALRQPLLSDR